MDAALPPLKPHSLLGVGIDTVEVARLARAIERHGEAFLSRVFTPAEISLCEKDANRAQRYAARWAAKEAAAKALGTGIGEHFALKSISVEPDAFGAPQAVLDEIGARAVAERGGTRFLLSLTHTAVSASAVALLVK